MGPIRLMPSARQDRRPRARKYSSSKMTCSIKQAPRPPYSFGHEMPTQPALCIVFCQARRFRTSRGRARRAGPADRRRLDPRSGSRRASARNSRRKAACSGRSAKSTSTLLLLSRRIAADPGRLNRSHPVLGGVNPCIRRGFPENPDANDARRDAIRYYSPKSSAKTATDRRAEEEGPSMDSIEQQLNRATSASERPRCSPLAGTAASQRLCGADHEANRRFLEDLLGIPLVATWCEKT